MKRFFILMLSASLLVSCSEYQKALKSEDSGLKYAQAEKKYNDGKYNKAIRLFEQMAPNYKGKPQAEKMFYMFAQSYYKTEQYILAGYQFETFAASYPRSEKAEEALYLSAKSYANTSARYTLDQVDTDKAIDKLQAFIDKYPDSEYLKEANETMKVLREKLEKKAYEIAYGYNKISDYKSAIVAFDNFIADYPGTPFREKALYYRFDSSYRLAVNSVPSKMEERLNQAKGAYNNLLKFYPNSEYKKEADEMLAKIDTDLKQFAK
ncbi:outer membrane protein assembly factor BamD [Flavobacterium selenitireducens]|uniref:outer membrane protein assembly factor BamD n=1 Tax=Flavobacterium selenitireducens TaxID=2722704 RepID=UPI00168AA99C|nr:outer membrane protein assembly factor BamD [Flavobacterium selenitireducens]MBD3582949.1 outer membrane protein assembly factor BamD [Flavobacterium selenitireducens]